MDDPSSSASTTATTVAVAAAALLKTVAVYHEKFKKNHDNEIFKGMVSSSFTIQYQSTGVGSLSLLDEIELK